MVSLRFLQNLYIYVDGNMQPTVSFRFGIFRDFVQVVLAVEGPVNPQPRCVRQIVRVS